MTLQQAQAERDKCRDKMNSTKTKREWREAEEELNFWQGKVACLEGVSNGPWDREQTVFGDGKRAGIREVVEWMKAKMELTRCDPDTMAYFNDFVWVDYQEWQAKLKEWGIE